MVLLKPFAFLCFIAVWACLPSAFVDRRLLCSSENVDMWYTYDGPLFYLSVRTSPCSLGVSIYNVTYTVIPMFTIAHFEYHVVARYNGQLWLEHTEKDISCEDFKICDIIKGESLTDSFPFHVKKFNGPEGEHQVYLATTITDELQGTLALRFNITVHVKNGGNAKKTYYPQLGVL